MNKTKLLERDLNLRPSQFVFVHPNLSKNVPSQFPLWFIAWYIILFNISHVQSSIYLFIIILY